MFGMRKKRSAKGDDFGWATDITAANARCDNLERKVADLQQQVRVLTLMVTGEDPGVQVRSLGLPGGTRVFESKKCPGSGKLHNRYANGGVTVYCERCQP